MLIKTTVDSKTQNYNPDSMLEDFITLHIDYITIGERIEKSINKLLGFLGLTSLLEFNYIFKDGIVITKSGSANLYYNNFIQSLTPDNINRQPIMSYTGC